jgi:UDP-3-O-[3-hydroxymyristoyl] N-acetylglucosamine deacetylase
MQHTLRSSIEISGIGLHSGSEVVMLLKPAPIDCGVIFKRSDVSDRNNVIPALWKNVVDTRLCSVIGNDAHVTVGTIEHLMAALRGCGVDNVIVELDGPEVPVMDGSSAPFVEKIDETGLQVQEAPQRAIQVLKMVEVEENGSIARLLPGSASVFSGMIDFDHPSIGQQDHEVQLVNGNFRHDIAKARTFGFAEDVQALRKNGLALGGSLENAIVLDKEGIMNEEGLRYEDEFIRHKLLDAIGDLYLAGGPILGTYEGHLAGHSMNNKLLHKLFSTKGAWKVTDLFIKDEQNPTSISITEGRSSSVIIA